MSAFPPSQSPSDADAVRTALERILARPEFQPERHPVRDWLAKKTGRIVDWIREFLGVSEAAADRIFSWLFYLLIALVVAGLLVWLVRAARRAMQSDRSDADGPSAPADVRAKRAAELVARARAASSAGDHSLALRLYFWALVVGLGERGGLEYRDAWTNRELLERGAPSPNVERVLRPLVPELDRKTFGRAGADAEDVARLSKLCAEMLGVEA